MDALQCVVRLSREIPSVCVVPDVQLSLSARTSNAIWIGLVSISRNWVNVLRNSRPGVRGPLSKEVGEYAAKVTMPLGDIGHLIEEDVFEVLDWLIGLAGLNVDHSRALQFSFDGRMYLLKLVGPAGLGDLERHFVQFVAVGNRNEFEICEKDAADERISLSFWISHRYR